jgi:hypothetical protein
MQSPMKEYNNSIDVNTTIRNISRTSLEAHEGEPLILIENDIVEYKEKQTMI